MDINFINISGRIGQDPQVKELQGGKKVVTFSIANTESFTDKDGVRREKTTWVSIVGWHWLADLPLKRGSEVFVSGKLSIREYTQSDVVKYITEVVAANIKIIAPRERNAPADRPSNFEKETSNKARQEPENMGSDDLPF